MKREMARALKAFADKMEAKTIAEGIEREEELQVCVELGIDLGQGYLLGRPADLSTFVPSAGVEGGEGARAASPSTPSSVP
jgi:EAL domain-containing protein (putative c-di-GMP-specific phosphodiesterase class I)